MITIQKLNEDRWQEYRNLRLEALRTEPAAFASSYEEEQLHSEHVWRERISNVFFAMSDDEPIGMAGFFRSSMKKANHVCEIYGMYVRKAYRRQGLGEKSLIAVLEEIRNLKGITKIKIGVNPVQKVARHLYEKYGFKAAAHYKNEIRVDGKFYDEIFLEKFVT